MYRLFCISLYKTTKQDYLRNDFSLRYIDGYIELSLEFTEAFVAKLTLQTSLLKSRLSDKVDDFKIICQNDDSVEEFNFDGKLLCLYSNVFTRMLENPLNKEAINRSVEIEDFSPSTINTFQSFLFTKDVNEIDNNKLSVELMMFSHKYNIAPLYSICKEHLLKNINISNIYDLIKASYLLDEDDFIEPLSLYVLRNKRRFKNTHSWKEFQTSHAHCLVKIMNFIMFDYHSHEDSESDSFPSADSDDYRYNEIESQSSN